MVTQMLHHIGAIVGNDSHRFDDRFWEWDEHSGSPSRACGHWSEFGNYLRQFIVSCHNRPIHGWAIDALRRRYIRMWCRGWRPRASWPQPCSRIWGCRWSNPLRVWSSRHHHCGRRSESWQTHDADTRPAVSRRRGWQRRIRPVAVTGSLTFSVPRRIHEAQRIVGRIAVPIQALRIPRLRHDRIRTDEPPADRIIPACAIIQQPRSAVPPLTREACPEPVEGMKVVGVAPKAVPRYSPQGLYHSSPVRSPVAPSAVTAVLPR